MIVFQKRFVRVGEAWFGEEVEETSVDVLKHRQSPRPPEDVHRPAEFHTLVIDLALPDAEILSGFDKVTAYQIRRAAKDRLEARALDPSDPRSIGSFAEFFDAFAATKDLPPANARQLAAYAEAGALAIRIARRSGESEILVAHTYVVQGGRARLLQSASRFRDSEDTESRNLIGRANRFLHWDDMLYFRSLGCSTYDFGGWYSGEADEEKLRINRFKEGFGGKVVREYNATVAKTMKGRLYLIAVRAAQGLGL